MNQSTSNQLSAGLNTDTHPKFQPNGTYRFALNATIETREGDYGTLSNEIGNVTCLELPYGTKIIGHATTENEEIVLFLFHKSSISPLHEIGIYNPLTCTYITIGRGNCLNFSDQHQINAFVRIRNGCERVVYFTDNYNPYRVANLTNTSDWVVPGSTEISDCSKIKFTRDYKHPLIALGPNSNAGGLLSVGTYNFSIRLIDLENNPTNWMAITRPVAIAEETYKLIENKSTNGSYDGGSNIIDDIGYVPKTNKSIELKLNNLDTRFRKYQVAVIKRLSTSGAITGVDILTSQNITSPNLNFIYTGIDSQIENQTSIDEILAETVSINKVKAHAQLDSRLYLGNIENTLVDYTGFQRHATKIKVEYVKTMDEDYKRKAKQPGYYFGDGSFLSDEIYALGVVYVFKDGTTSPVFHIPGRAADTNIKGSNFFFTSNWKDTDDVTGNPNVFNPLKTKRWQVYNTCTLYNTPIPGHDVTGLMGYYETNTTYPIVDAPCDTDPTGYWGNNRYGEPIIAGVTKIRHHRMPDATMRVDPDGAPPTTEYKTGVYFTMSFNYPHPDIVGHYYVHSDRTFEKTIVDKGVACPLKGDEDPDKKDMYAIWFSVKDGHSTSGEKVLEFVKGKKDDLNFDRRTIAFLSPKTTLEDMYSVGSYIRLDKVLFGWHNTEPFLTPTSEKFDKIIHCVDTSLIVPTNNDVLQLYDRFNYVIDWNAFLKKSIVDSSPNSIIQPTTQVNIMNLSIHNNWLLLTLDEAINEYGPEDDQLYILSIKNDIDVFTDLSQISYKRMGNLHNKNGGSQSFVHSYDGDIFLTDFNVVDYAYTRHGDGEVYTDIEVMAATLESEYAYGFRHGDIATSGEYSYLKFNKGLNDPFNQVIEYVADKYYEPVPKESSYFYPEKYLLNKSFNYLDPINRYLPLPSDYEYCNGCLQEFPFRIYYSELDDQEQSQDNYRIIKPLDYQDLPGLTGEINDLFNNFSKLYAITQISPYYIPTRPQQLVTNESSVYIGTSEVFGTPAQQMKVTDYHFGGSTLFKSRCSTEYGTFYVDDFNGIPFFIDDKLNDLSLGGMRNFWQENGKVFFEQQFYKKTGTHYPNMSTSSSTGVGYITTYDPRFKRLIVHKKDYKLITALKLLISETAPTTECIWFNYKFFYHVNSFGVATGITFDDPKYFECKSFTLSYSFMTKSWVSFHSYLPYYLFNNYLSYYSTILVNNYIYKHLEGNHTQYYGIYKPHIVDLIAVTNANQEFQYDNLIFASSTKTFDINTEQYKNVPTTFNSAIFYNSKQSSGVKTLKIKSEYFETDYNSSVILLSKTDNKYKAGNLRDSIINEDQPIWNSSWAFLKSSPFNYIDKVPNLNNLLSVNNNLFKSSRFKDYYLGIRLISNPTQDIKMNTDIINTRNSNRTR